MKNTNTIVIKEITEAFMKVPNDFLNSSDMCFKNTGVELMVSLIDTIEGSNIAISFPLKFNGNFSIEETTMIPTASFIDACITFKEPKVDILLKGSSMYVSDNKELVEIAGRPIDSNDSFFSDIIWLDGTQDKPTNSNINGMYFIKDEYLPEADIKDLIEYSVFKQPKPVIEVPTQKKFEKVEESSSILKELRKLSGNGITMTTKQSITKAIELTQDLMEHLNNLNELLEVHTDTCITINKEQFSKGLQELLEKSIDNLV